MPLSLPMVWRRDLSTWLTLPMVLQDGRLVARVGNSVRAFDPDSGDERWQVVVDPGGGAGHLLHASGDLCVTDRRPDPLHETQLVVVRDRTIARTIDMHCIVTEHASVVVAGGLYAIGNDPRIGPVFRGVDLESGATRVDVPLPRGANSLLRQGDRFLILNRMDSPGLYWVNPDGRELKVVEETPAQDVRIAGTRVLAALRSGDFPKRTVQARDLATDAVLWTSLAHGPVIGLDGDAATYYQPGGPNGIPVLCDSSSGEVRWQAPPLSEPSATFLAGSYVFFGHMTGLRGHRRSDGQPIGDLELGALVQTLGNYHYLGGFKFMIRAELND